MMFLFSDVEGSKPQRLVPLTKNIIVDMMTEELHNYLAY